MKNENRKENRYNLPETLGLKGRITSLRTAKVPILELLRSSEDCSNLVEGYRQKVLPQTTRTIRLLGRKNPATILYTLLGYEVRSSYMRIQCPDLVTARYIRLFSELGCHTVQLPYDPTRTAELIPEFEAAVERITLQIRALFPRDKSLQNYAIRRAFGIIRSRLRDA
jgi:hypothetical protein